MFDIETASSDDLIDVRDMIAEYEYCEDSTDSDDQETAQRIKAILDDLAGYGGDEEWRGEWYPVTLIRDSYFTEYAQELVEDCGFIPADIPDWIAIDWESTARAVRQDYSSIDIDGVTFWYR